MRLKSILHIDDDEDDLSIFQEVIARISPYYLLDSFSDSRLVIKYLEETILKPNIIFLDINMPVQNGLETLHQIRANEDLLDVPVIIYSTTIREQDYIIYRNAGANELIKKAGNFDEMLRGVAALLNKYFEV